MSLESHFNHFKFFQNKELNEFYASVSLSALATSLISIFVPVYLYQLGYSIPAVIFYFFLSALYFVLLSYPGAKIVSKIGVKHSILFSIPFFIAYYIGLKILPAYNILFFILPLFMVARRVLFNYSYHLDFIINSNKEARGRQLSIIGIINIITTIIAPLVSGVIIYYFGFNTIFIIGSIILTISALPLFLTKDIYEKIKFDNTKLFNDIFKKKNRGLLYSFSGYAIESIIGTTVWPIFLIILLLNTKTMGIVVTLSMVISVLIFYFSGRMTDKYSKVKLLKFGTVLYFFSWVGRLFADSTLKVLFIDSYKNISEKILHLPWEAYSYDLAQKKDYFAFIVEREIIFNLSRVIIIPFIILLFYINFFPFLISFIVASLFSLLYIFIINNK